MRVLIIPTLSAALLLAVSTPAATLATEPQQAPKPGATAPAATTERDPICAMSVDTAAAKTAGRTSVFKGKTYYFCNDSCKKQFDADPAKFAQAASGETGSATQGCCGCCGGTAPAGNGANGRMCGRRMR